MIRFEMINDKPVIKVEAGYGDLLIASSITKNATLSITENGTTHTVGQYVADAHQPNILMTFENVKSLEVVKEQIDLLYNLMILKNKGKKAPNKSFNVIKDSIIDEIEDYLKFITDGCVPVLPTTNNLEERTRINSIFEKIQLLRKCQTQN